MTTNTTGKNRSVSGERETAMARVRRYVEMRDANPLVGLSDVVHAIHGPVPDGAELLLSDLRVLVRTAAPTAPSTAAGEMAFVCGCGWDGSYADLNETVEGMTCPKCRLSRNMVCATTPPAQEGTGNG